MPQTSKPCEFDGSEHRLHRDVGSHTASAQVSEIKQRLNALQARIEEIERERIEVAAAMKLAEAELEAVVAAPVPGGEDPTLWLPDELLLKILVQVANANVVDCSSVCRRWQRLCQDRSVIEAWEARWELYAEGKRKPQLLDAMTENKCASIACAGTLGTMFCGKEDGTIHVRSGKDHSLLGVLVGHMDVVHALAIDVDGTLVSGSKDGTIRVWSGQTGAQIWTLEGHAGAVNAVAVNGTSFFSGSEDGSICVWLRSTGHLVHTFTGNGDCVCSLALGTDDQLYSGCWAGRIRVWSATDYSLLRSLEGQTGSVWVLAVDKDGDLYSGSDDCTIYVWSGTDGILLRKLKGHTSRVTSLSFSPVGTLFSAAEDHTIRMWRAGGRPPLVLDLPKTNWSPRHAFTHNGHLWVSVGLIGMYGL